MEEIGHFTLISGSKSHVDVVIRRGKHAIRINSKRRQLNQSQLKGIPLMRGDVVMTGSDTSAFINFTIGGRVIVKPSAEIILSGERSVEAVVLDVDAARWNAICKLAWKAISFSAAAASPPAMYALAEYESLGFIIGFDAAVAVPLSAGILAITVVTIATAKPTRSGGPPLFREGFSPGAIRG